MMCRFESCSGHYNSPAVGLVVKSVVEKYLIRSVL